MKITNENYTQDLAIINSIKLGLRPIVTIQSNVFEEAFLEEGMKARIISLSSDNEENDDVVYEFVLDFSEFYDFNKQFAVPNYYDSNREPTLTAEEAGYMPSNKRERIHHSINYETLFFVIDSQSSIELAEEYSKLETSIKDKLSYTEWLENELIKSRNK